MCKCTSLSEAAAGLLLLFLMAETLPVFYKDWSKVIALFEEGLIFDNRGAFGNSLASVLPVCFRLCCRATPTVCPSLYLATFRRRRSKSPKKVSLE